MVKTKKITLRPLGASEQYAVIKVTDSLEYRPGHAITKKEAQELVAAKDWQVTVTQ